MTLRLAPLLAAPLLLQLATASPTGPFALDLPSLPVSDRVSLKQSIDPHQTHTLATLDGPGCIRHIWLAIGRPGVTSQVGRKFILRIYFDDSPVPQVEAPVGDFFGAMNGVDYYDVNTALVSIQEANGYNCYFEMPFSKSARIEIESGPERASLYTQIDWHRYPGASMAEKRRFNARWRREMPAPRYGENFTILDADGPGNLIGFFYGVRLLDDTDRWSHGGGENLYIDGLGDAPAYVRGIGGEDAFGTSYGGVIHHPQSHLYAEMPYYTIEDVGEARGAQRVVGYRFYLVDSVRFAESIRFQFGSMANDICATVYWYQEKPPRPYSKLPDWAHLLPGVELPGTKSLLPAPDCGSWLVTLLPGHDNQPAESPPSVQPTYHGFVDFNRTFRPRTHGVNTVYFGRSATARCVVESTADVQATVRLAWDDDLKLQVNDANPLDLGRHDHFRQQTVRVNLKKGANRLAVTLSNEAGSNLGGWAFALRLTTSDGTLLTPHADSSLATH